VLLLVEPDPDGRVVGHVLLELVGKVDGVVLSYKKGVRRGSEEMEGEEGERVTRS